jgi:hypothetical protein
LFYFAVADTRGHLVGTKTTLSEKSMDFGWPDLWLAYRLAAGFLIFELVAA